MHLPTLSELTAIRTAYVADNPAGAKAQLDASQLSGNYWSATEVSGYASQAWIKILPGATQSSIYHKATGFYMRCVR